MPAAIPHVIVRARRWGTPGMVSYGLPTISGEDEPFRSKTIARRVLAEAARDFNGKRSTIFFRLPTDRVAMIGGTSRILHQNVDLVVMECVPDEMETHPYAYSETTLTVAPYYEDEERDLDPDPRAEEFATGRG